MIKHFNELGFTVVATPNEYRVEYAIYDHEGYTEGGEPVFHRKGSSVSPDFVDTLEESEPYLHGDVNWNGCSNWHFDEQDNCMLHGCSKEDLLRYGKIMGECWDLTKELCPNWIDL